MEERNPFTIRDLNLEAVEEYSDGSRLDGAAAAATSRRAEYLGMHATVTDAEMVGVLWRWRMGQAVSHWTAMERYKNSSNCTCKRPDHGLRNSCSWQTKKVVR